MTSIQEKLDELEKKVEEKKRSDDASDFDRAKREVKEEAGKAEVNVDLLHEKLIHLESVARKTSHESKEKLELILRRFHVHKKLNPSFVGNMVLTQISSKEEEAVLNKEQKLYKRFNMGYPGGTGSNTPVWGRGVAQPQMPEPFWSGGQLPTWHIPQTQVYMPQPQMQIPQPRFGPISSPRLRHSSPNKQICFRCNKPGHFVKNCQLN